jgi:hypothetical protein
MMTSQAILKNAGMIAKKKFRVKSKSNPDKSHIVERYQNGEWHCDCLGFYSARKAGKDCRHIRIIKNHFNGKKYRGENY